VVGLFECSRDSRRRNVLIWMLPTLFDLVASKDYEALSEGVWQHWYSCVPSEVMFVLHAMPEWECGHDSPDRTGFKQRVRLLAGSSVSYDDHTMRCYGMACCWQAVEWPLRITKRGFLLTGRYRCRSTGLL
jgi:hypothetical protein